MIPPAHMFISVCGIINHSRFPASFKVISVAEQPRITVPDLLPDYNVMHLASVC